MEGGKEVFKCVMDLVPAAAVGFFGAADGVTDFAFGDGESGFEFTEEEEFTGDFGVEHEHGVEVAIGHDKNVVGAADHVGSDGFATEGGDVEAEILHGGYGIFAGLLPCNGAYAAGEDFDVTDFMTEVAKESLGHGASTNVSGADKEDAHDECLFTVELRSNVANLQCGWGSINYDTTDDIRSVL